MPAVETQFRVMREPWARLLTGGSTGGWIALAHQVFYPDFYGGTFSLCPDARRLPLSPDRQHLRGRQRLLDRARLDEDRAAEPAPARRQHPVDDEGRELVRARRRRQVAIGRPVGHLGGDLQPGRRATAIRSGSGTRRPASIDKTVAEYWKKHYDLRHILETNWTTLGPKVAHKINVYIGDMDSYYLTWASRMLDEFLKKASESAVHRRDRVPADGAALLGPARRRAADEDRRARHQIRAAGYKRRSLALLTPNTWFSHRVPARGSDTGIHRGSLTEFLTGFLDSCSRSSRRSASRPVKPFGTIPKG